jgi:phenylalanyl-tRNA synthetase beta subunit
VPAGDVTARIREAAGDVLADVSLVGTYRGHPLGLEERSLTFRLRFGAPETSVSDAAVDAAIGTISASLTDDVGARIRG